MWPMFPFKHHKRAVSGRARLNTDFPRLEILLRFARKTYSEILVVIIPFPFPPIFSTLQGSEQYGRHYQIIQLIKVYEDKRYSTSNDHRYMFFSLLRITPRLSTHARRTYSHVTV